jgi:hypothetical protein
MHAAVEAGHGERSASKTRSTWSTVTALCRQSMTHVFDLCLKKLSCMTGQMGFALRLPPDLARLAGQPIAGGWVAGPTLHMHADLRA